MKFKKIIASLIAVTVIGVSMPTFSAVVSNVSITASAEEDYTEETYNDFILYKYSDHVEINKYTGDASEVVVPSEIGGLPVTNISEWAWSLFPGCKNLASITIPNSVTSIGESAFAYCENLKSVTISNSVTSIGYIAFSHCTTLTSVTIPDSITSIGRYAFFGTSWLENKQKEDPLVIVSGILIYGETCSGNVTIPDSVTSIGEYAFSYCENLTSIIIPNSVTSIGEMAFSDCKKLTSVTIPDSVISVGYQAFAGCSRLESVTLLNPECEIYDNNGDTICNSYDGDNETYTYSGVIKGYSGSTAEAYAKKYDRTFESLDEHQTSTAITSSNPSATLIGDTNEDEEVNLADAVLIMQNLANPTKYKITEQGKINGDVDETGDGITPNDAFKIQQYVLGIIGTLTI